MSQISRKAREGQMEQSKAWISEAYLCLLKESSIEERITLSSIAAKAGVSRQTLYRHFSNTEEILDWHLEKEFALFLEKSQQAVALKDFHYKNLELAVNFFKENASFILTLVEQKKEYLLLNKLELFTRRFSTKLFEAEKAENLFYKEQAFTGSLYMIMRAWLQRGQNDSPEILYKALLPYLK